MSQNRALPSFWAALLSRTKREMSGGVGTGTVLSAASPAAPPPPPAAPADCRPPKASAMSPALARSAIASRSERAGRWWMNFTGCTERPLCYSGLGSSRGVLDGHVPAAQPIELRCRVKRHGKAARRGRAEVEHRPGEGERAHVAGQARRGPRVVGQRGERALQDGRGAQHATVLAREGEVRRQTLEALMQDRH